MKRQLKTIALCAVAASLGACSSGDTQTSTTIPVGAGFPVSGVGSPPAGSPGVVVPGQAVPSVVTPAPGAVTPAPGVVTPAPGAATPAPGPVPPTPGAVTPGANPPNVPAAPATVIEPSAPGSGRRLTKTEYLYTIEDVLGVRSAEVTGLVVADSGGQGFRNAFEALLPSERRTSAFSDAAASVAAAVPQQKLTEFSGGCDDVTPACATNFVSNAGRMLFRRPVETDDVARYSRLFTVAQQAGDGFGVASKLVIEAMLQSPRFLYRLESAARVVGDKVVVDAYERATRLSYLLWQSAPDLALLDAAAGGQLEATDVQAVVEGMVASPKFRRAVRNFAREWLQLYALENRTKDAQLYPEFNDELKLEMEEETLAFFEKLVVDDAVPFMSAFTAEAPAAQGPLGQLYGATPRPGFLTQASVLTAHSIADTTSIVDRGLFLLGKIFCQPIPAPPESIADDIAEAKKNVDESLVQREVLAQHRDDPKCSGCHSAFDPLGNAFEAYDGIGRFQAMDTKGNIILTSGEVTIDGLSRDYANSGEFASLLASSALAKRCVVKQVTEFAFGRVLDADDNSYVDALTASFDVNSQDLRELFKQVALTPAFHSYVPQDQTFTAPAETP